jgi:hypothetical protein
MTRIEVRPGEGRRVRLPNQDAPIPPEGQEVDLDLFVRRRLDDGDLVLVTDDAGEARKKKAKP